MPIKIIRLAQNMRKVFGALIEKVEVLLLVDVIR